MNTNFKRFSAILMAFAIIFCLAVSAGAATVPNATIATTRTGSIDLYKYDLTRANTDDAAKAMIDSYVSTGVRDTDLEAVLDDGTVNDLGNGQQSYGYAIKGVEFSYLKVADICTYDETEANGVHKDMVLYKFDDSKSSALLSAIGLSNADAYPVTSAYAQTGFHFFESDTLIDALSAALAANATTVKNALESYMASQNAGKFAETDAHGHASVNDLPLGLYLLVETKVRPRNPRPVLRDAVPVAPDARADVVADWLEPAHVGYPAVAAEHLRLDGTVLQRDRVFHAPMALVAHEDLVRLPLLALVHVERHDERVAFDDALSRERLAVFRVAHVRLDGEPLTSARDAHRRGVLGITPERRWHGRRVLCRLLPACRVRSGHDVGLERDLRRGGALAARRGRPDGAIVVGA